MLIVFRIISIRSVLAGFTTLSSILSCYVTHYALVVLTIIWGCQATEYIASPFAYFSIADVSVDYFCKDFNFLFFIPLVCFNCCFNFLILFYVSLMWFAWWPAPLPSKNVIFTSTSNPISHALSSLMCLLSAFNTATIPFSLTLSPTFKSFN